MASSVLLTALGSNIAASTKFSADQKQPACCGLHYSLLGIMPQVWQLQLLSWKSGMMIHGTKHGQTVMKCC